MISFAFPLANELSGLVPSESNDRCKAGETAMTAQKVAENARSVNHGPMLRGRRLDLRSVNRSIRRSEFFFATPFGGVYFSQSIVPNSAWL
jgi:hypothetical protein